MEEPIAIIGMGCRFPGGVYDSESFWQLLINQVDAITPMPGGRFNIEHYYDPNLSASGKIVTREGGFIDGIDQFDADFFNISAYEASHIDPQQRLLLETTWDALENGGMVPSRLAGSNTGVFVGMWTSDYENLVYSMSDNIDLYVTTGAGRYSASGRLSYGFDFRGPSLTLDTACSSSLVAIHLACQSLRNGESNLSIAGGANLIIAPQISIGYSRAGMLSPDARCKFGDVSANGYVRSEGVGVIVLKRLSDALADGDPIRAVIRGSAVNNDGQVSGSLVAPGIDGQIEMLREAYRAANVDPAQVSYIEAHGTGTRVGDPVELKALGAVLGEGRSDNSRCWIGSVKTNIGHTEAASGMAGLIKAVLSLEHNQIPASLHFHTPNPDIPWDQLPFELVSESVKWSSQEGPLYAGVNSFGVTGTNAHVILESAPRKRSANEHSLDENQHYILPISAHKPEALSQLVSEYQALLSGGSYSLNNLGYSAAHYRSHHPYRAAFVGQSTAEIVDQIANWSGATAAASSRKLAFVFPGQGGQWMGMGRQLIEAEPVFRDVIERCEQAMQPYVNFSLTAVLNGTQTDVDLEDISVVQPTIFAVQVALAELWRAKGIEPDAVIGHSMGEVAAAYTAGILSLQDAAKVICMRSYLMRRVSGLGTMAVVELSLDDAQKALVGYEGKLSVAVNNAPRSVVVSGDPDALDMLINHLQKQDIFCRKVKVDVAAHSPHMDALRPELVAALAGIQANSETTPIYSTVIGSLHSGSGFDGNYWGRNLREPVLFSAAVEHALADGINTFIEIGPHPVLLPAIERGLSDYDVNSDDGFNIALVESMRRDEDQLKVMAEALAKLYCAGYELDWNQFYPSGELVSLPNYPWQRQRYWVDIDPDLMVKKTSRSKSEQSWNEWLYQPIWEPVELSAPENVSGTWLIFADGKGIGQALAQQLENNARSIVVFPQGTANTDGINTFAINPTQPQDFQRLLAQIRDQLQGVVYLWGVDVPDGVEMSIEDLEVAQHHALGGLLHLTQALIESRRTAPIWIVTQGAQGVDGSNVAPAQATLWGLGRVIREEQPDLWGGLIDLDPTSTNTAYTIQNELASNDGEDQLAYRAGQRYALRLTAAEVAQSAKAYPFRADGTYLITGGLGDVGLNLAKWMVEHGARRFIMMGRTVLPPRGQWRHTADDHPQKAKIDGFRQLEALGASVHIAAVDIADEAGLRAYLQAFDEDGWPTIVGVIHAAGSLDVNLLQEMDWSATRDVLRPKVLGGSLLQKLLPDVELFVNISSINALLGLPGQGNYAAANAFLDSLSAYRHSKGQRSLSINWGVWKGLGYAATQSGAESSEQLAEQGIQGFSAQQGVQVFGNILNWNAPTITVVPADWRKYGSARSGARQFPLLKHLLEGESSAVKNRSVSATQFVEQLVATDAAQQINALTDFLQQAVAQILRIPAGRIKPTEPLGSYGLNSLMGMELRNRLERDLGITLSATLVWNYPTVELMSAFLAKKLGIAVEAETVVTAVNDQQAGAEAPIENLIADFATLSDDDILKALMDKS